MSDGAASTGPPRPLLSSIGKTQGLVTRKSLNDDHSQTQPLLARAHTPSVHAHSAPYGAIQGDANAILFADNEADGETHKSDDYDSDDEPQQLPRDTAGGSDGLLALPQHFCGRAFAVFANSRFIRSLRNPTGEKRRRWNFAMLLIVLNQAITIPLRFAFHRFWDGQKEYAAFLVIDYLSDVMYLLDMGLAFVTPFNEEGFFVTNPKQIAAHYVKNWLLLDVCSIVPVDLITFDVWKHALLRTPRLIRMSKFEGYFKIWEQFSRHSHVIRIAKLMMGFFVIIHWWGCAYISFGYLRGFNTPWLPEPDVPDSSLASQYLYGLFWAANIVTGEGGKTERPTDDFERGVALLVAFVAIFVVAAIIGNVEHFITSLNENDEKFRQKLDDLNLFMTNRRLPEDLQTRIRNYYRNIWNRNGGLDDATILSELPVSLRSDVSLVLKRDIIHKVPLFQRSSGGFVNALVTYLQPQIYSPDERVMQAGDIGSEMYFIRKGKVRVILPNGEVVATLKEGDHFGEIALLEDNSVRTATIKAVGFCDLFVLTKEDLETVFKSFPEQKGILRDLADTRTARGQLRAVLQREPLFAGLNLAKGSHDEHYVQRLADAFHHVSLAKLTGDEKNVVFEVGDSAERLYFVAKGQVELWRPVRERDVSPSPPPPDTASPGLPSAGAVADADVKASEAESDKVDVAMQVIGSPPSARASVSAEVLGKVDGPGRPSDPNPSGLPLAAAAAAGADSAKPVAQEEMELFAIIGAGNFFGECAAHDYRVTAKVSADSLDTLLLGITARGLQDIVAQYADCSHATLSLARRLRVSSDYMAVYSRDGVKHFWPVDAAHPSDHLRKSVGMPDGFVSGARYLAKHKYPNTKVEGLIQNVKHPWLARFGTLNTKVAEPELQKLSAEELLIAFECLQSIRQKLMRMLFTRADA